VTYTLAVTNAGAYTDTFDLSLSGNAWPAAVVPSRTLPLGPGGGAAIIVRIDIPQDAAALDETVAVRATSGWTAAVYDELALTTRLGWRVYLPLVGRQTE
jgi:uncharacterized membrane protein